MPWRQRASSRSEGLTVSFWISQSSSSVNTESYLMEYAPDCLLVDTDTVFNLCPSAMLLEWHVHRSSALWDPSCPGKALVPLRYCLSTLKLPEPVAVLNTFHLLNYFISVTCSPVEALLWSDVPDVHFVPFHRAVEFTWWRSVAGRRQAHCFRPQWQCLWAGWGEGHREFAQKHRLLHTAGATAQ